MIKQLGLVAAVLLLSSSLPAAADPAPSRPSSKSPEAVARLLRDYATRYPQLCRLVRLGDSHEGRPVWALAIGRGLREPDDRPVAILNAAHHGGELLSVDVVLDAVELLLTHAVPGAAGVSADAAPDPRTDPRTDHRADHRADHQIDQRVGRFLDELVIWAVPMVNPDGVWAVLNDSKRSDRKNARDNNGDGRIDSRDGVDLNRNYPYRFGSLGEKGSSSSARSEYYRGPAAASEPEVQAMIRLADSEHPATSISYHTGTVAILAPYTIDGASSPTPDEAWLVAQGISDRMPRHPQDRPFATRRNIYPVDGTDQDFLRHQHGTLALLVESARRPVSSTSERLAIVRTVRRTWMLLLDRYLDGPAITGRVVDASGQPVVAAVSIDEIKMHEGEQWTTRCRDGRFDRFLPRPGSYTVRAQVPGQPPLVQKITVEKGRARVDFTVPASVPATSCPPPPGNQ